MLNSATPLIQSQRRKSLHAHFVSQILSPDHENCCRNPSSVRFT